jgi:hypothetical protein
VRSLRPKLTRYEVSLSDVGKALARALMSQIDGDKDAGPRLAQFKVPMTLLSGESDGRLSALAKVVDQKGRRPSLVK